MGLLDDLFKSISDFFGGSGTSSNNTGSSSNISSSVSSNQLQNIKNSIKKKYKTIDGENKLIGNLYIKLINNTNDIIGEANTKKENTNLK